MIIRAICLLMTTILRGVATGDVETVDIKCQYLNENFPQFPNENVKQLVICDWNKRFFNPVEVFSKFPNIEQLSIIGGNLSQFVNNFPSNHQLQKLSLTNLMVKSLPATLFDQLTGLQVLNISGNRIQRISPDLLRHLSLKEIFLADNPWDCRRDWSWILEDENTWKIRDLDQVLCSDVYPGKAVRDVFSLLQTMKNQCPHEICSCSMSNIVWDLNRAFLHPVITVNCSHRQLKEMPSKLPLSTTILLLQNNNISDLTPLANNSFYQYVQDIYLDNNSIMSIDTFEGAEWLKKFRVLSLRNNKVNHVRPYALNHAFEQNRNIISVYLGDNPWKCDCAFTPGFQLLLLKYQKIVKDIHSIKCEENSESPYSLMQVVEVPRAEICSTGVIELNPWDILNVILASLIFGIFVKLSYDYWIFRRTGRLPWIATKIP